MQTSGDLDALTTDIKIRSEAVDLKIVGAIVVLLQR